MSYLKFFLILIIIVGTNSAFAEKSSKQNAEICGEKTCEFLLKEMKKFAKNGSPVAQATVAVMYADGIGTKMDQELSFKYIKKAANNGLSFAEYTLGMLYRKDQIVGKYGKDADYWLRRAAKGNYQPAIDLLVSENKLLLEETNGYQQAVYTPRYEEGVEVIEVNADKYSLTDFYDLLKNEGYGNPSQTGSRIKGRGCGNNSTACNFIDINSQEGALRFLLFTLKINR
jgi:TPR repeat protein